MILDQTHTKFGLPESLNKLVASFEYKAHGVRGGVLEPFLKDSDWKEIGVSLMLVAGHVRIHTDSEELPPYCYHFVLRNDKFMAKGPKQLLREFSKQTAGTTVLLNIHEPHHLVVDSRFSPNNMPEYELWASLYFIEAGYLAPEEVSARFRVAVNALDEKYGH